MSFTSSFPNRSPQAGHLRDRLSMFFWTHSRQNVCMHRIRHVVFSRSSQTLHRSFAWASRSSDLSMSSPACAACARRRLTSRCAASSAPCSFVFWSWVRSRSLAFRRRFGRAAGVLGGRRPVAPAPRTRSIGDLLLASVLPLR